MHTLYMHSSIHRFISAGIVLLMMLWLHHSLSFIIFLQIVIQYFETIPSVHIYLHKSAPCRSLPLITVCDTETEDRLH